MIKRGKRQDDKRRAEPFTYIHQGTTLRGSLKAEGRVRVHGMVYGTVEVKGTLEVAESGCIEGEHIEAGDVKILGLVKANIHASGKVEIWKQGRLEGDVSAAALDIEEGASFIGRSEMNAKGAPIGKLTEKASLLVDTDHKEVGK